MTTDRGRDSGFGIGDSHGDSPSESRSESPIPNPKSRPAWWRTLDELADDPAFAERLTQEFPSQTEAIIDPVQRRTFLKLMGASLALGGFTACTRQPAETIVPYVRQPEEIIPGRPLFFATAMPLGGVATGLLVESHEGRPTKVEGNPDHPASLGATDVFAQAAVLGLYDPDRSQTLTDLGEIRPWSAFLGAIRATLNAQGAIKGAGLRLLTESVNSPTLAAQIRDLLARFPSARWHQWDPASRENVRAGAKLAFGEYVETQYRFDKADVILSLDADFLTSGPGSLRYAHDFASRRRPEHARPHEPALRAREHADPDRRPRRSSSAAAGERGRIRDAPDRRRRRRRRRAGRGAARRRREVGRRRREGSAAHRGASLVVAGEGQPPAVHALAHAMNDALGNVGQTVVYTDPVEAEPVDQLESLRELTADMSAGKVDVLIILGGNPAYTAPADIPFAQAMDKVGLRVHLSLYDDETSERCHWQIPEAHFLEAWSDARGHDGTISIVQPLIAPLYDGKSAHDVLAAMSDRPDRSAYDAVRAFWAGQFKDGAVPAQLTAPASPGTVTPEFESHWRRWLHDGVLPATALPSRTVSLRREALAAATAAPAQGLEIAFRNDPTILDGRFANNGWLQELPKPITRLTWDNAVLVSPPRPIG